MQSLDYMRRAIRLLVDGGPRSDTVADPSALVAHTFFVPPGHFYSPWPDPVDAEQAILAAESGTTASLPGIRIDDAAMQLLWRQLCPIMETAPFPEAKSEGHRYYFKNEFFSYGDALVYYGILGKFRPRRLIEIGSGYSSALVLDGRDQLKLDLELCFVEPYPAILKSLIQMTDKPMQCELVEQKVQSVPLDRFAALQANDILFIDSSHVAKTGSDVCFELFAILPALQSGVLIHIHDMFWPFEYPRAWVLRDNRAWNELYFVRTFLMHNADYDIVFFNDYFAKRFAGEMYSCRAPFHRNPGGSLWLQKR